MQADGEDEAHADDDKMKRTLMQMKRTLMQMKRTLMQMKRTLMQMKRTLMQMKRTLMQADDDKRTLKTCAYGPIPVNAPIATRYAFTCARTVSVIGCA